MARRGRCRCGEILMFRRGPNGYKQRCPKCGAVVRLRAGDVGPRKNKRRIACVCGTVLLVGKRLQSTCPTCGRSLASALAANPNKVAGDAGVFPALLSSTVPSKPAPQTSTPFSPAQAPPFSEFSLLDQDPQHALDINSNSPQREALVDLLADSYLKKDGSQPESQRRTGLLHSYWFWLAVCGVFFILLCLAAAAALVIMHLVG